MTNGQIIVLLLLALVFLSMCGCVVATKHDFVYVMKANESIGYMRGLSDCADILRRRP